ncbi:MAG: phosphotransferase [Candidatus Hydrogenedentes bacterium]|nr:phosphotransferase [Candidatus Hydrogenedentota bacterium]
MAARLTELEIIGNIIREHYDLGEVQELRQLKNTHQRRHRKVIVKSEAGKFLAKTYKNDPSMMDALYFQHNLSGHLKHSDLPVAAIQKTRDGHTFVWTDDWALELQGFIGGGQMLVTEETLQISGDALGKFHQVCQGLPTPLRDARKWRFSEVPEDTYAGFYDLAAKERDDDRLAAHDDKIQEFLVTAHEMLDIGRRYAFETGIIHGDWHSGNLLFQDEKLKGIIDMEFAGDGCYLEDLSYAVSNLCIRTTTKAAKMEFRTGILLKNYEAHRVLSYAERVALYYAVGVKHVTTVCYQTPQLGGRVAGYTPRQWMAILDYQTRWLSYQAEKVRLEK